MEKNNPLCVVCGSEDLALQGPYRGAHSLFTKMDRTACRACGMVFAAPMPHEKSLDEYNASYFDSAHGGTPKDSFARAFFSGMARLRLAHVENYLEKRNIEVSCVLEYGPGSGFFARHWLAKRSASKYFAVETDSSCHGALAQLGVARLEASAVETANPLDLVVMSHVLEHVPDPSRFLADTSECLRQDGALFIEVPCRDWEHKPLDEPHLLFFDKRPLQLLLEKSGFKNIQLSYHGETISRLRSAARLRAKILSLRSLLIKSGLVAPFARCRPGMESLSDPLERAAVAPCKAYQENTEAAWWLRAVAQKA